MDTTDTLYCAAAAAGVVAAAAASTLWLGAAAVLLAAAYALRQPLRATREVPRTHEGEAVPAPLDVNSLVKSQHHSHAAATAAAAPRSEQLRGPGGEVKPGCGASTWSLAVVEKDGSGGEARE